MMYAATRQTRPAACYALLFAGALLASCDNIDDLTTTPRFDLASARAGALVSVAENDLSSGAVQDLARAAAPDLAMVPICQNGRFDGDETDVDCGGSCPRCPVGGHCVRPSDCQSNNCNNLVCAQPAAGCNDAMRNGDETDVDCGGLTCPRCALGRGCKVNGDCQSGYCSNGLCATPPMANCVDGIKNGDETDIDCGGLRCGPCAAGKACKVNADCQTNSCNNGFCGVAPPNCMDGIKNGNETDRDCGGPMCQRCPDGKACLGNNDCQNGMCAGNICQPPNVGNCMDGIKNGSETDIDCGGGKCPVCRDGRHCAVWSDCIASACENFVCVSCMDGVKNGGESDIDCGGVCRPCDNNKRCTQNFECKSGVCSGGLCKDACRDGIRQGYETDVDCGGYCPPCGKGQRCQQAQDCLSMVCLNLFCQ